MPPSPRYHHIHQDIGPWMLALGGCGEFGANLTLYGSAGVWIAVDCGMAMNSNEAGITEVSVPSLAALDKLDIRIEALLITHGHEDHIGAIPALWRKLSCPIYATAHTHRLISAKLNPNENGPRQIMVKPMQTVSVGPFSAQWLPVTHSIPEAQAICLEVAGKRLYHSGDWKLDAQPMVGPLTAQAALQQLGRAGVDVVIGDSTNATVAGSSRSEQEVAQSLAKAMKTASGRLVVVCFASNVARMHSIVAAADRVDRYSGVLGRSIATHVGASRASGYLDTDTQLLPNWELGFLPREQQCWIATGSQAEPGSALVRLSMGNHPAFGLQAGDTVLFSSRVIPGHEQALEQLCQRLRELGVHIIDDDTLHASGHPPVEDLTTLYGWLKPRYLLPVHGETRHQEAHMQVGRTLGMDGIVPRNGDLISLTGKPFIAGSTVVGKILQQR